MKLAILFLFIGLVLSGAEARAQFPAGWQPVHLLRGAVMGVRKARADGEPVLLVHGIFQDSTAWEDIGPVLANAGLDVWAIDLSHSFPEIANRILPAAVDEIAQSTRKRVTVVGHSMGALATQLLATGGFIDPGPVVRYDARVAALHARTLRRVILLAPPENLSLLKNSVPVNLPLVPFSLPSGVSLETAILAADTALGVLPRGVAKDSPVLTTLFSSHFTSIVNVSAFDIAKGELPQILADRLVPLTPELRKSFEDLVEAEADFGGTGRSGERGRLTVPALFGAGSLDGVAASEEISRAAQALGRRDTRFQAFPGNSHLDLINGARAGQVTGQTILGFIRSTN